MVQQKLGHKMIEFFAKSEKRMIIENLNVRDFGGILTSY